MLYTSSIKKNIKEFEIGIQLMGGQKFMEALERFKTCVDLAPNQLANIQIALYKKLHVDIENLKIRIVICELYIFSQRYQDAILEIEDIIQIDPEYTQSYFMLSKIYSKVKAKEKQEIKSIFETAFSSGITDFTVLDLLAKIYFEERNDSKSILLYERLLKNKPQSLHYLKTLSDLYHRIKDFEKSAQCYEKLCSFSPDYTQEIIPKCEELVRCSDSYITRSILIKLYSKNCDIDKMIFEIKKLINIHPSDSEDIEKLINEVLLIFPEQTELLLLKAKVFFLLKRHVEGLMILKSHASQKKFTRELIQLLEYLTLQTVEDVTIYGFAYSLLFDLYFQKKVYKKCVHCIDQAILKSIKKFEDTSVDTYIIKLLEVFPDFKNHLSFQLFQFHFNNQNESKLDPLIQDLLKTEFAYKALILMSKSLVRQKKYKKAHAFLLNEIHRFPHDKHLNNVLRRVHKKCRLKKPSPSLSSYEQGLIHLNKNSFLQAIDNFQKVELECPDYYKSQYSISYALFELGRFDLSSDQLERIISNHTEKNNTQLSSLLILQAIAKLNLGYPEIALSLLNKALETHTNPKVVSPLIYYVKSVIQYSSQAKTISGCLDPQPVGDQSSFYFVNVPNNGPTDTSISFAQSQNNQGVDYFLQKNIKAAEQSFNIAYKMDPSLVSIPCNLSICSLAQKKYDDCFEWLTKAEKIQADFDIVYLNRGLCLMAQNELKAAKNHFRRAIDFNPLNLMAHISLGDIYSIETNLRDAFTSYDRAFSSRHLFNQLNRRTDHFTPISSKVEVIESLFNLPFFTQYIPKTKNSAGNV
ncbi:hypothetical protein HOG98_06370 [bacterium]|jgi:tetratricopeptide (TPR) repeat protein|nr:hypothetical protein [bacterium]